MFHLCFTLLQTTTGGRKINLRGRNWKKKRERKLEAPEKEYTFVIVIVITVSVQVRRNDRLQSYVCGYLQGLLPQNSQVLFIFFTF